MVIRKKNQRPHLHGSVVFWYYSKYNEFSGRKKFTFRYLNMLKINNLNSGYTTPGKGLYDIQLLQNNTWHPDACLMAVTGNMRCQHYVLRIQKIL